MKTFYIIAVASFLNIAQAVDCNIHYLKPKQADNLATSYSKLETQYATKTYTLLDGGAKESTSFKRLPVVVEGKFHPKAGELIPGETSVMIKPTGTPEIYDGQEYLEFPNSTALKISDGSGNEREFIFTRGVRAYETKFNLENGSISPQGYVSDVLMFEIVDGRPQFVSTILKSNPEKNFLFEDPRISILYHKNKPPTVLLSGTDYSPHVEGSTNPDVMNRYVELNMDSKGTPRPVPVHKETKRPQFKDMSPAPFKSAKGDMVYFDAKNATVATNEKGQIVVRTRLRPDFGNSYFTDVTDGETWKYAEQVFVFDSYDDFQKYEWKYAIEDLYGKNSGPKDRLKPAVSKTIIKDKDLPELYKSTKVLAAKGKGLGPGTIPVRIRREGNKIFISDGVNAPEQLGGTIPAKLLKTFPVKEGEVKFVAFDHEIRYFEDASDGAKHIKRHYSASVKLFDDTLTKIDSYYSDVIQPKTMHEIGDNAGVADLQHVYPMGRILFTENGVTQVRIYAGASDAHTMAYNFDIVKLLSEMATDSPRRLTKQVR